jgi:catechol 2,3-dioxygenase-like lactoylglutathione lyase family enzyme
MSHVWKPGINHIEFWVSNLEKSISFYEGLFLIIGWKRLNRHAFSTGTMEIYFKEVELTKQNTLGPRHICFQAIDRQVVESVYNFLKEREHRIIRGPLERNEYSEGYYTIDFYHPDGFVIEVAYTPHMIL